MAVDASKPLSDAKSYRLLTLFPDGSHTVASAANTSPPVSGGLRVLLIHDPPAPAVPGAAAAPQKALFSIAVGGGAGSAADPDGLQGLAHFCEHLLFMGSAAYPRENAYDAYLAAHGGATNAFTEEEATVYMGEVNGGPETSPAVAAAGGEGAASVPGVTGPRSSLCGALDLIASLLREPLFGVSTVSRELSAIESEFAMQSRDDDNVLEQVQRASFVEGHPLRRFGWGNTRSLRAGVCGVDATPLPDSPPAGGVSEALLIKALRAYHGMYYTRVCDMAAVVRADGTSLGGEFERAVRIRREQQLDGVGSGAHASPLEDGMTLEAAAALDALQDIAVVTLGRLAAPRPEAIAAAAAARAAGIELPPMLQPRPRPELGVEMRQPPSSTSSSTTSIISCGDVMASLRALYLGSRGCSARWNGSSPLSSPTTTTTTSTAPRVYFMRPIADKHRLYLTWALPPSWEWHSTTHGIMPDNFLGHLLGHEARGSILALLKARGWATALQAGVEPSSGADASSSCALFDMSITATPAGIRAWRDVVELVCAFIHHVLCGGVNVLEAATPPPPPAMTTSPLFQDGAMYTLLDGTLVRGSTLSLIARHTTDYGGEAITREITSTSLLSYDFDDPPEASDAANDLAIIMALRKPAPEAILTAAGGLAGPLPDVHVRVRQRLAAKERSAPPVGGASAPSLTIGASSSGGGSGGSGGSGFAPAAIAFFAAHLHPRNMRVDIMSSLAARDTHLALEARKGVERFSLGEEEGGGEGGGSEGSDDEDEEEDDGEGDSEEEEEEEEGEGEGEDDEGDEEESDDDGDGDGAEGGDEAPPPLEDTDPTPPTLVSELEAVSLTRAFEPWFGCPYVSVTVDAPTCARWLTPPHCKALFIPSANTYIPTNTNLLPLAPSAECHTEQPVEVACLSFSARIDDKNSGDVPQQQQQQPLVIGRLWHKQDYTHCTPRTSVRGRILSRALANGGESPSSSIHASTRDAAADVWCRAVRDAMNEELYQAECAGLVGSISPMRDGPVAGGGSGGSISISVTGFSDQAPTLFARLMNTLTCTESCGSEGGGHGAGGTAAASAASAAIAASADEDGPLCPNRLTVLRGAAVRALSNARLHVQSQARAECHNILLGGNTGQRVDLEGRLSALTGEGNPLAVSSPLSLQAAMSTFVSAPPMTVAAAPPPMDIPGGGSSPLTIITGGGLDISLWSPTPAPLILELLVMGNETPHTALNHFLIPACTALARAAARASSTPMRAVTPLAHTILPLGQPHVATPYYPAPRTLFDLSPPLPPPGGVVSKAGAAAAAAAISARAASLSTSLGVISPFNPPPPSKRGGGRRAPPPFSASLPRQLLIRALPAHSPCEVNGVTLLLVQAGADTLVNRARIELLAELLSEPLFDTLRTRQQLGYTVSVEAHVDAGIITSSHAGSSASSLSLAFLIQSATHHPGVVLARLYTFLHGSFWKHLTVRLARPCAAASSEGGEGGAGGAAPPSPLRGGAAAHVGAATRFEAHLESFCASKLRPPTCLSDEEADAWDEISGNGPAEGRGDFSPHRLRAEVSVLRGDGGSMPATQLRDMVSLYARLFPAVPAPEAPPSEWGSLRGAKRGRGGTKVTGAGSGSGSGEAAGAGGVPIGAHLATCVIGRAAAFKHAPGGAEAEWWASSVEGASR